jgi:hypothetical protein
MPTLCQLLELVQTALASAVEPELLTSLAFVLPPLQATSTAPESNVAAIEKTVFFMFKASKKYGGSGEIRTHEQITPSPVFKTGAFNRSATLPRRLF